MKPHAHATPDTPELRLVLGDQLNPDHPWFSATYDQVVYVLMETRSETDYVLHHAQKVLAIFAAMRNLADQLRKAGHRVRYVPIDSPSNRHSLVANLQALVTHYQARSVRYQAPDEHRVDQALATWATAARTQGVAAAQDDTTHFYTTRLEAQALFAQRRTWLMEHFYRHMRMRHAVLMDGPHQPTGGRWNFDANNRKPWPGTPSEPVDWRTPHDHRTLWGTIEAAGVRTFGAPQAGACRWPLNRSEALAHLQNFITHALPHFGDYQDAISQHNWRLFHSLLSFALNVKMLNPRELVAAAESAWLSGHAPLHAAEGFIRQILGWREYVRGVYWAHMPSYAGHNTLNHTQPLPEWFWTGRTQMACVGHAIRQSLREAYAHHIQRLMVIGNFALLAGLDPHAVHQWYLGVYVDAFEWVELPNTVGMSQFADGGLLATKPYVSSAAYLSRMGDHCAACRYNSKAREGDNACPFNALYWHFHLRHADKLHDNPRLAMVYRQLDKMDEATKTRLQQQAERTWQRLEVL